MKHQKPTKAKILCAVMTAVCCAVFLLAGIWQMQVYSGLKADCTAEVSGTVTSVERLKKNKTWFHIQVQNDVESTFPQHTLSVKSLGKEKGETVIIHYSPAQTDKYYIDNQVNGYLAAGIAGFAASGLMLFLTVLIIHVLRPPKKKGKA